MGECLPTYAGEVITTRVPHAVQAYVDLPKIGYGSPAATVRAVPFDLNAFLHNAAMPFEVHRMIPRVIYADTSTPTVYGVPDQDVGLGCIEVSIREKSSNRAMTAGFVPLLNLVKGVAEQSWEWTNPMTLVRGQGYVVQAKMACTVFPFASDAVSALRLQLSFEGYMLVMPPASDRR